MDSEFCHKILVSSLTPAKLDRETTFKHSVFGVVLMNTEVNINAAE